MPIEEVIFACIALVQRGELLAVAVMSLTSFVHDCQALELVEPG